MSSIKPEPVFTDKWVNGIEPEMTTYAPFTMQNNCHIGEMFAVPDPSFVLKDTVGEMYFCNLRCFCVWSVQLATRPNLSIEVKTCLFADHSIG